MATALLINADFYDRNSSASVTLRWGSVGYNLPSGPGQYDDRIIDLSFSQQLWSDDQIGGAAQPPSGTITLANDDAALDMLRSYGSVGRSIEILIGDETDAYGDFAPLLVGRMRQVLFAANQVTIQLYDRMQDLLANIQAAQYAGTNVAPNGLEGGDDIAGKPKPVAFGVPLNVTPIMVNSSKLIYQFADISAQVANVYDAGAALTAGTAYSSLTDLQNDSLAPAAGDYKVCADSTGSYFRLGASPTGTVTCDVEEGASAADRTIAQCMKRLVTRSGGISSGDINAGDVTALDAANSAVIGDWIVDSVTMGDALGPISESDIVYFWFDVLGKFRMRRLEAPSSPAANLVEGASGMFLRATDIEVYNCQFLVTGNTDQGIPVWRVDGTYAPNWTVQSGNGLAGSVSDDRKNFLNAATRNAASALDTSRQTSDPSAAVKQLATLFSDKSAADTLTTRALALFAPGRDYVSANAQMTKANTTALPLATQVNLTMPRFGYTSGRNMIVTGIQYSWSSDQITLSLWG